MTDSNLEQQILHSAERVISIESNAVADLKQQLDQTFVAACTKLLACQAKVVVIGMGKSGHIGSKMAATLASTGTPAFFVHPAEASHGDLGMIGEQDVVIALSNSGETHEVTALLPVIKRRGIELISITSNDNSSLAKASDIHIKVQVEQEACPHNLAPTASTTAVLALGDAIAVSLLEARGFTPDDFALSHPGGSLGKRLIMQVNDLMHSGDAFPSVKPNISIRNALFEMTDKRMGMTTVTDEQGNLLGIFTDGDLRRAFERDVDIDAPISDVMTKGCKTVKTQTLAVDAVNLMEESSITSLIVVDENSKPLGVIHMHDLLKAGVV
ncbi:D-arabinose 5-phosphate isomerase [Kangiella profundi]|uniref:Arabinose 5-phosphate isomerase n=1 Tax=Kangiella profundi TaxID=1561924 RepID=A0A2K9APA8_9GAMM|nr:KpsF/GutQ family sugar-phosphate isomerase [Kangiella profundi]AUD78253.1 D-arabinose 5-phosphate isomerase [Kangiella profundi]GGF06525.1 arabinose 5-phosphate isomerase KdsD [Kangiella profundi]